MEFHDILHGLISVEDPETKKLISDLLDTTEVQRLRNMRQMNFDVPLIQELGRSRRLPHSIGVTNIAIKLCSKSSVDNTYRKELIAASLLHDAAIPPYGHLVESELNQASHTGFQHAKMITRLIDGTLTNQDSYVQLVPGRNPEVANILQKHKINGRNVSQLISPDSGQHSPIAADIDIDNIDNVHRMATMLGWHDAIKNINDLLFCTSISEDKKLTFSKNATPLIENWLNYRQRIYTLIIAHPECIPSNAFQSDLIESAVEHGLITNSDWYITEPVFEEKLRNNNKTKDLASQLISGCTYQLLDYVWLKNLRDSKKLSRREIKNALAPISKEINPEFSLFIWYEKKLISREVSWILENGEIQKSGIDSHSCMIALVKKTRGGNIPKLHLQIWRESVLREFQKLSNVDSIQIARPSDYNGNFWGEELNSGSLF